MIPFSDATTHHRSRPLVNISLIAINGLVFLYSLTLGGLGFLFGGTSLDIVQFFYTWGFIPAELTRDEGYRTLQGALDISTPLPTWATILSSMFMHGGLLHFAGNMAYLWVFGDNVEDHLGHIKYLIFYLVAGLLATLSHWYFFQDSNTPLIGASGAISGVLGAYLLLYPYNRINVLVIFFLITAIRLPAMFVLGFYFLLQLYQLLFTLGVSESTSVALWAHIGGFVAGAIIIALYKLFTRQPIWPPRYGPPSGRSPIQYWRGRPL